MIWQLVPIVLFCLSAGPSRAEEVGRFGNDWTGNGIVVEAVADPKGSPPPR
jgi:CreA protein